jgi:hypothetical protein
MSRARSSFRLLAVVCEHFGQTRAPDESEASACPRSAAALVEKQHSNPGLLFVFRWSAIWNRTGVPQTGDSDSAAGGRSAVIAAAQMMESSRQWGCERVAL